MTAIGYALVAVAGKVWLHEVVSAQRWTGIALIVCGVVLVGVASPPQTVERRNEPS